MMDKEAFCRQLYDASDDDKSDEFGSILRRYRQRRVFKPSTFLSSVQTPSARPKAEMQLTTNSVRTVDAGNGIGDASGISPAASQSHMEMGQTRRSPKGTTETNQPHRTKIRKTSSFSISGSRQIFKGLVFFFIPNDDISPARRMRIQRSIEFGARRATEWCNEITHVIVDRGLTFEDVVRYLKLDSLPATLMLVNETYPGDCISKGTVLEGRLQRFHVQGAGAPPPPPGEHNPLAQSNATHSSNITHTESLQLKSPWHKNDPDTTPEDSQLDKPPTSLVLIASSGACHEHDTGRSGAYGDALDELIQSVKANAALPVDLSDEEDDAVADTDSESEKSAKNGKISGNIPSWQKLFSCMHRHDGTTTDDNPNAKTIEILQQMLDYYERTADQWRCLAYRKAISALRKEKEKVISKDQALKIRGIGERLASKIEEIVWTHRLRRLEYTNLEPNDVLLSQFTKIYGAGFAHASKWISQGYRSLDDLRQQARLTTNQRIGLDHYDDFLQRIPRTEVEEHGEIVKQSVINADPSYQIIICGSYRRGAPNCGDIDMIITKDGASLEEINRLVLNTVVPDLFEQDFLKAHLAVSSRADSSKWHGASALPGNPVWRRIDLMFVPGDELGAALIYFTGNDVFNRSLRLLASKKGMCLNQKGLFADILRRPDRAKLNGGHLLESRDERQIFELLGVPWRPPHHRIC